MIDVSALVNGEYSNGVVCQRLFWFLASIVGFVITQVYNHPILSLLLFSEEGL